MFGHIFVIPSPLHEPGSQTFFPNPISFTRFITCLVFDKLLGPFCICSTWGLVRSFSSGVFYFLFPIIHMFIKFIMVIPFGNSHVLGKGFSLSWCKQTVSFRFLNCLCRSISYDWCLCHSRYKRVSCFSHCTAVTIIYFFLKDNHNVFLRRNSVFNNI